MDQQQLLAQLTPVFCEQGYEGATLTRLAAATGLGKASLYHHFPGGKAEIASSLLRLATAELDQRAFSQLHRKGKPAARLAAFIDGFAEYAGQGTRPCLIGALAQGAAWDTHQGELAQQFERWTDTLAATFEQAGAKPKRARREADALLAALYGSLQLARLRGQPKLFRQRIKALKRALAD